jgi:tripartite-type tricarboxylate transporter receptor subunit TctC
MQSKLWLISGIAATAMVAGTMSSTAGAREFYKGRTLNILINYSAGGNTDIQGRSVMRYMKNHIPGKPRILFRHLPGAGGIVAANFLGDVVKNDGFTLGVFTVPLMAQMMKAPQLRVNLADFIVMGAISQQQIAHMRKTVKPGMNKPSDILKVTEIFKTAGHGPESSKDLRLRMMMEMLQIKHDHVTGYKSAGRIRTAIMQNEVHFTSDSVTGYFSRVMANLIKPGISIPIWHMGHSQPDGTFKRSDTVPADIPTFQDIYQMKFGKGKIPSGAMWDSLHLIAGMGEMLRIFFLPKGSPKAAVTALRGAWVKTMKDPGYQAEYRKQNGSELSGHEGAVAQKMLNKLANVEPRLQKFLLDFANKGRK